MGNTGAASAGMKEAPVTLKESVDGILSKVCYFLICYAIICVIDLCMLIRLKVDSATREKTSGTFQSFDDSKWAW